MYISIRDEIYRRAGHVCFHFHGFVFIWGGIVEHLSKKPRYPNTIPKNNNDAHFTKYLFRYDPLTRKWTRIRTTGDIPPRCYGSTSCVIGKSLYVFGGHHLYENDVGFVEDCNNELYELHLTVFEWEKVNVKSTERPPKVEKSLVFAHDEFLFVFGGYGFLQCGYEFCSNPFSPDDRGWTGGLWRFCTKSKVWTKVRTKGKSPSPRAGHAGNVFRDQLVLFGGRSPHHLRLNDIHILDLLTWTWREIRLGHDQKLPAGRSLHSFTPIDNHRALIYGGINSMCQPLNDCWILDLRTECWTEVELPYDHGEVRCWHGACRTDDGEVIIHSGLTQEFYLNRIQLDGHAEDILTFNLGVKSLFRVAFEFVAQNYFRDVSVLDGHISPNILSLLKFRLDPSEIGDDCYPPDDGDHFDRQMIHDGI